MSGRGHAGDSPIPLCEHGDDLARRKFAQANLDERADDPPAHFVEEPIAFDDHGEHLARALQVTARKGPHGGGFGIAGVGGKRLKIVPADEESGGGAHGGEIEGTRHMPG